MIIVKTEVVGIWLRFIADEDATEHTVRSRPVIILDLYSTGRCRSVFTGDWFDLGEHKYGVLAEDGTILELADQAWLHELVYGRIRPSIPYYMRGEGIGPLSIEDEAALIQYFEQF